MRIVVIGLGYVGLPLAHAFAAKFDVVGLDISAKRVAELKAGHDRTEEVSSQQLRSAKLGRAMRPVPNGASLRRIG